MVKCCIKECKSEKNSGCEIIFYGFPLDEKLKTKWIEATGVTGNVKYKRICALHFKNEDFNIKSELISLKPNIIPSFCKPPFRTFNDMKMIFQTKTKYETDNQDSGIRDENGDAELDADDNSSQDCNESLNMLTLDIKPTGGIARCKCCLESNGLKHMWQEHFNSGLREVYGHMLIECFALHWNKPRNPMNSSDFICEPCITRLKDAISFKTEVLASEQLLSGELEAVDVDKLKQERDDLVVNAQTEYLHYEYLEANDDNSEVDRCDNDVDNNNDDVDNYVDDDGKLYVDNNNDDADNYVDGDETSIKSEPYPILNETLVASHIEDRRKPIEKAHRRKLSANTLDALTSRANAVSKRLRMSTRVISKVTKSEDDLMPSIRKRLNTRQRKIADFENLSKNLRKSVEVVRSRKMSETMAAMAYNVPRELIVKEISKTPEIDEGMEDSKATKSNITNGVVFVEVRKIIDEDRKDSKKTIAELKKELNRKESISKVKEKDVRNNIKIPSENRRSEMRKQANNIAIIIESTNATPIRRHGGIGYGCAFCDQEFPDAADLKQHTIKEHDMKTKRNYAKGKKPSAYLVKLDITGLKCNLCGNEIDSLEQLYDHLIEIHKKLLYRNAKNYIVPFKFDREELRCLFCEFICNSFKGLLEHMRVHYRNHICEICDAGFLTKNNLFNHAGRHKKGTFQCDYCPKVFDTSSKKTGHQRLVHSTNGVNRCGYCGEMFGTYRRKEKHLITEHGVTLKKLKCKACDKTFETQTALRIHTKRDHLIERRFQCSVCDKRCFTNVQLNQHILKHTGIKKFQCSICLKAYGRKSTLREHMRIHENDRRFKCELCGMAFVQKCSWRGHMLSKHGQQV